MIFFKIFNGVFCIEIDYFGGAIPVSEADVRPAAGGGQARKEAAEEADAAAEGQAKGREDCR